MDSKYGRRGVTVIAYRYEMLACDSLWASSHTIMTLQSKIVRLPSGALYGASGDIDDRALVPLLGHIKTSAGIPSPEALGEIKQAIEALLVLPNGEVWIINTPDDDDSAGAYQVKHPYTAIGCGKPVALGAMAQGANAAQAVAAACEHNVHCRGPVHVMPLRQPAENVMALCQPAEKMK